MLVKGEDGMSRISIDITDDEHKKLKAMAAHRGQSIKEYVLERTLGTGEADNAALQELEKLLDTRIRAAQTGAISRRTPSEVFAEATREKAR
jgi:Antitoxin ParD